MSSTRSSASWLVRFVALFVLFLVFFIIGSMAVAGVMPEATGVEPGLVPETLGLLIVALANVTVVAALILTSRMHGWKLAISLALAYYGAVTFLMQIETWFFLTDLTVSRQLLPRLFVMGLPTAFLFIPIAVWVLGKARAAPEASPNPPPSMPVGQWIWKLATLAVLYLVLYWSAGYFIAWQNPELRAFYGSPGEAGPFLENFANTIREQPMLFPFQVLRSQLWVLCALPVIRGSRAGAFWTAVLVGLLFSLPQNIGHILANPLLPVASVRLSHMVETASSTFVFGLLVVWLLHRKHRTIADLFPLAQRPATFIELL